jgi:hypothetical protein
MSGGDAIMVMSFCLIGIGTILAIWINGLENRVKALEAAQGKGK